MDLLFSAEHKEKQMVSRVNKETVPTKDASVYGHADARTLDAIDRVAEQMLMPRSWVVTQILREWSEGRSMEIHELEEAWNGSVREELGERALELTR